MFLLLHELFLELLQGLLGWHSSGLTLILQGIHVHVTHFASEVDFVFLNRRRLAFSSIAVPLIRP